MRRMATLVLSGCVLIQGSANAQATDEAMARFGSLMKGETTLSFERLTSEGKFAGCELIFVRLLDDIRSGMKEPDLVKASGVVVIPYNRDRGVVSLVFKLQTGILQAREESVEVREFQPAYARLSVEGPLDPFEKKRATCDGGGVCVYYVDDEAMGLSRRLVTQTEMSVTLTLREGGLDQTFWLITSRDFLSKGPPTSQKEAYSAFSRCWGEVLENTYEDLKELSQKEGEPIGE